MFATAIADYEDFHAAILTFQRRVGKVLLADINTLTLAIVFKGTAIPIYLGVAR